MQIIRTIHPVGQGAFYSERFISDNGDQNIVVYDCGAKSSDYKYLTVELSSYFQEVQSIDLFFVSHFDEDHINGIIQLKKLGVKIRTVVVPLIDQNDKWFYICTGGPSVMGAISDPKSFFGSENVIEVESVGENSLNEIEEINNEEINIHGNDGTIKSGSRMPLSGLRQNWFYIPYNFDENTRRNELVSELKNNDYFVNAAKENNCTVEDLLHNDNFIEGNIAVINSIYKGICSDGANRCSLVVYSGPIRKKIIPFRSCYCETHNLCGYRLIGAGCLYLGDTDLNQGKGKKKIIKQLKSFLMNCIDEIGTIQLPHHGAIKNFNNLLLSYNDQSKLFFASFGNGNTYGHPSYNVIEEIIGSDNIFCGVNENRGSGLVEHIRLR